MKKAQVNREAWLNALVDLVTPWLKSLGYEYERERVKITCGWPSRGATSARRRTLGQCHYPEVSEGKRYELFISPVLATPEEVSHVVVHELLHVALPKAQHGPAFAKAARVALLEGKPTATVGSEAFYEHLRPMLEKLGSYPHERMSPSSQQRKQGTRMLKVECASCGYTARTTRKWLDEAGPPLCPCSGEPMDAED
jgi:hypothetical protein